MQEIYLNYEIILPGWMGNFIIFSISVGERANAINISGL